MILNFNYRGLKIKIYSFFQNVFRLVLLSHWIVLHSHRQSRVSHGLAVLALLQIQTLTLTPSTVTNAVTL